MAKNLVIVESPAKAKTIGKFLGPDFEVKASFGHIRDLPKGDKAVDIQNKFKPIYEVSEDKKTVVNDLKKLAAKAEMVWLASDEDREGEAIAWHLSEALHLNPEKTQRIVFHEITKNAILKAVQNPRQINMNLVNAQQARRVLDRLVGFELSPILWKKVRTGLSAGRVQSVAVRLIVDREREIINFKSESFFKIYADFYFDDLKKKTFKAESSGKFSKVDQALHYVNLCNGASFSVKNQEVKPGKRTPSAPFTTSTLQQEASRKLGFSVAQTMRLAQTLYEAGHITYMRTDSVNLSEEALQNIKQVVENQFGKNYYKHRSYKTKTANAQEAHEAIRPTHFENFQVSTDAREQKLYELIWKRTVASQMEDAILEKTVATIEVKPLKSTETVPNLVASGEVIRFDGFLKLYLESEDEEDENDEENTSLPPLKIGQILDLSELKAIEKFTRPAARYHEAALVKKLEELGIGRPSTYAPTISTIQAREYVVKESRDGHTREYQLITLKAGKIVQKTASENTGVEKNKLFPTDLGILVTDFLVEHFGGIVDYSFTAKVEQEFDVISLGNLEWTDMLQGFYFPFHSTVQEASEHAERANKERVLGNHPISGKIVVVRLGRYGPYAQIGAVDDEEKLIASLRGGQRIETISLEEALELFKLPRNVGEFEGKNIKAAIGRFGPYVQHDNKFYSIPKGVDPLLISLEESIELIQKKREADANKQLAVFQDEKLGEMLILNGRWGPYLSVDGENVKIPKGTDITALTAADCVVLYEAHIAKNGPSKKKKVTKTVKTTKKTTKEVKSAAKTTTKTSKTKKK